MTLVFKHARRLLALLSFVVLGGCQLSILDGLDDGPGESRDGGLDDCVGAQCELCANEQLDPLETAVDCGGVSSGCPRCAIGRSCEVGSDCTSQACVAGRCAAGSCGDEAKNGDETDIDCGGTCEPCAPDLACEQPTDCADGVCSSQVCQWPSCPDGVQNGNETDLDCGGGCGIKCSPGDGCEVFSDCNGLCVKSICRKPYPTGQPSAIPGLIQAEDFDEGDAAGSSDDTAENLGSSDYRESAVDLDATGALEGAVGIAYTSANEWLEYTIKVASAGEDYNVELSAIANETEGRLRLELDGERIGEPIAIPAAVGTPALTVIERNGLTLPEGNHVLRLVFETPGVLLDWLRFSRGATPFGESAPAVPGTIQAEDFNVGGPDVAYLAGLPGSPAPHLYRATDVDLEVCPDTGGGFDVTGTRSGDWLDYTVEIAGDASYVLRLRVATDDASRHVTLQLDGDDLLVERALPNTGGFRTYSTLAYPNVPLSAGRHTIRVLFVDGLVNFNWFSIE